MSNGELSEVERLKLENYALRHSIMQGNLQQLLVERNAYLKQLEENHPGYAWDETRGLLAKTEDAKKAGV